MQTSLWLDIECAKRVTEGRLPVTFNSIHMSPNVFYFVKSPLPHQHEQTKKNTCNKNEGVGKKGETKSKHKQKRK